MNDTRQYLERVCIVRHLYLLVTDSSLFALDKYANNNGIIGYSNKVLQFGTLRAYTQL